MPLFSTFFNLGTDYATSTLNLAGIIFSDFNPFIVLVGGVLLALLVIGGLILMLKHH